MNKKRVVFSCVLTFSLCLLITGFTYAYWRLTYTQTGINKVISSCFSMELANEKNSITLDNAYPISDEKGKALTPYSFTITNTCNLFASYTINLEMLEGTTLDSKYVKTIINSEAITNLNSLESTDTSIEGATESRVLFKGSLGSGDSTDYTLRIWMDGDTPPTEDTMNKIFQGKITVTAEVSTYSPVENGFTNLAEALLVNEYQTTSLDVAKERIASKQEVDLTKTAPIIEWQPLTENSIQSLSITKADPFVVGTYNIVEKTSKILLGKSYSFSPETGYYSIEEKDYYNPVDVDYSSDTYYLCGSSITATVNNSLSYWDGTSCSIIYKVMSLDSVNSSTITLSDGDSVATKIYTFKVYKMYETELESDKSDKGLYEALDDYGTTYYYRGNVTNNYVRFGGFYWRVVRINGDGSIRILYAGTTSSKEESLIVEANKYSLLKGSPSYIGYMYSNSVNSSYDDNIKNENDSNIKTKLDNWYKNNIFDKGYSSYIADSGFCKDRSIAPDSPGSGATADKVTYYASRYRVMNYIPTFNCSSIFNDLFTLNGNSKGNEKLTYPIGLLTVDELAYAGLSYGYLNKMSYTYSTQSYWTMSPSYYNSDNAMPGIWLAFNEGNFGGANTFYVYGIRPVINLKADTEISGGIGTANDPFIVK